MIRVVLVFVWLVAWNIGFVFATPALLILSAVSMRTAIRFDNWWMGLAPPIGSE